MKQINKTKYFPCPSCKGQGGEKEIILDDGSGPWYDCGWCEGEGMVEIGGEIHMKRKYENLAMKQLFKNSEDRAYDWDEIRAIGREIFERSLI